MLYSSCHAHKQNDEVLGSLLIKFPLKGLDDALDKSTKDYFSSCIIDHHSACNCFNIPYHKKDQEIH